MEKTREELVAFEYAAKLGDHLFTVNADRIFSRQDFVSRVEAAFLSGFQLGKVQQLTRSSDDSVNGHPV